jgi:cytochrome oxidase Cu insertion factor (SCO1/SenC/PrrC family)
MTMRTVVAYFTVALCLLPGTAIEAQTKMEGPPEPTVHIGDVAPDFTLKDQDLKDVSLSSYRGKKNVVLAFYVFAFTGG